MVKLINGRQLSERLRDGLAQRVKDVARHRGAPPSLAVILVGDDPASGVYVRNKVLACERVGVQSTCVRLASHVSETELLRTLNRLNHDDRIDGILVQLPLPAKIAPAAILRAIAVDKDVDGFHPQNVGDLVTGVAAFSPCTPLGVMALLDNHHIPVSGQNAVVVGASNIVGKPVALMLTAKGATVTLCHALTRDLTAFTRQADILVVAAGVPGLITPKMVKPGVVVIDVGINRLADGRITGDVDYEGVSALASHITPVPGGVGPMTVTMLLQNTITSAERRLKRIDGCTASFTPPARAPSSGNQKKADITTC